MILAGIDEAGYGPLLGPLVVCASAFAVPGDMQAQIQLGDFAAAQTLWPLLKRAVARKGPLRDGRLIVADSKLVHAMAGGTGLLERTVLAMLRQRAAAPQAAEIPATTAQLLATLGLPPQIAAPHIVSQAPPDATVRSDFPLLPPQPWYCQSAPGGPTALPAFTAQAGLGIAASMLTGALAAADVALVALWAIVMDEDVFNRRVAATGNKATVLASATFAHVAKLAEHFADRGLLLVVDKQGGRAHYVQALLQTFPGWQLKILKETPEESSYFLHHEQRQMLLSFREKSETTSFAAALASMTAKYLRELLMAHFNAWFCARIPGLKPTAGYYQDGKRWLEDAAPHLPSLNISHEQLIRIK